jgi:hypothetical protein
MNAKVTRSLMVGLSEDEVSTCAKELARVTAAQAELEDEKKAATSGFKNRIDRCVADCRALAQKVTTRRELRDIDCEWQPSRDGKMILTRMDTGEIIDTRKMTEEEHQQSLPLAGAQKKEKQNA